VYGRRGAKVHGVVKPILGANEGVLDGALVAELGHGLRRVRSADASLVEDARETGRLWMFKEINENACMRRPRCGVRELTRSG
jgi:hypothetical protein